MLILFTNANAHHVMRYFHWHHPFGVVDVHEMPIFTDDFLCFLQDFLVVEFGVIPTFEVEGPTLNFWIVPPLDEFIYWIKHPEMLCFETLFYRQYFVAKSSYLCLLLMNRFHERMDNPVGIKLRVLWVNLNENHTLNRYAFTLTLVSIENNNRFSTLLVSLSSFYRFSSWPFSANYFFRSSAWTSP